MQPTQTSVTLTASQIRELNQKLSHMRHNINNCLSLVVAATELLRYKPEMREKMINTLTDQTPKIVAELAKFTDEFERSIGMRE